MRVSSSARRDNENYWRHLEEDQPNDAKGIAAKPTGVNPFGALGSANRGTAQGKGVDGKSAMYFFL